MFYSNADIPKSVALQLKAKIENIVKCYHF